MLAHAVIWKGDFMNIIQAIQNLLQQVFPGF